MQCSYDWRLLILIYLEIEQKTIRYTHSHEFTWLFFVLLNRIPGIPLYSLTPYQFLLCRLPDMIFIFRVNVQQRIPQFFFSILSNLRHSTEFWTFQLNYGAIIACSFPSEHDVLGKLFFLLASWEFTSRYGTMQSPSKQSISKWRYKKLWNQNFFFLRCYSQQLPLSVQAYPSRHLQTKMHTWLRGNRYRCAL